MRFESETKNKVQRVSIHLELIMYGDAFLDVNKTDDGMIVNWLSLCDGGDVADRGERCYSADCFASVVDSLYDVNYPKAEDKEMNVSWEIMCFDQDGEQIAGTEWGYWDRNVLIKIIQEIQDIIKDENPLLPLIDTLEA